MEPASNSANPCARFSIGISGLGWLAPRESLLSPIIRSFVVMADVSGCSKRKIHLMCAEQNACFPSTQNEVEGLVCCSIFVYQLKSLPPQAVALEIWLAIVEGA